MFPGNGRRGPGAGNAQPGAGPSSPPWLWLIALAAIFGLVLLLFRQSGAAPTAALSYTAFLEQVQRGNVAQVDLRGEEGRGALSQAIVPTHNARISGGSPRAAELAREVAFFTSTIPELGD